MQLAQRVAEAAQKSVEANRNRFVLQKQNMTTGVPIRMNCSR